MKNPYPIILNLAEKNVAVIGGGQVAARKINKLNEIGVVPTVVSPNINVAIDRSKVKWVQAPYSRALVAQMDILIACTDDTKVNALVKSEATHFQLVNNTSDKTNSNFYNLATVQVEDVLVAVSTLGVSPAKTKRIRNGLIGWLTERLQKES